MEFVDLARKLRSSTTLAAENPDLSMFSEEPVSLDVFIQDNKFLGNPRLSLIQYNAVRAIERIYYPAMYPLLAAELDPKKTRTVIGPIGKYQQDEMADAYWGADIPMINRAVLQWGKGSGKDHVARMASMRIAYLLMCLYSPQKYFGMPEQDTIHLLNVASSSLQAQQNFFTPITKAVKHGWFENRCEPHVNSISYEKNIDSISGHSDADTQEGLNLILGVADEIDAFKSRDELLATQRSKSARDPSRSAESILDLLDTSSSTRFPETHKVVCISYPRFKGSMIQKLTQRAKDDIKKNGKKSKSYVSGPLATWDVNPRISGKEVFADKYEEDPILAAAKYECKPARSLNPYFGNRIAIESCMLGPFDAPALEVDYIPVGNTWDTVYTYSPNLLPIRGAKYAMHGDLAVKGDRAGIALAHVVKYQEYETNVLQEDGEVNTFMESRPFIKVDFAITYKADVSTDPPREIQIRWARQLAFDLVRRGFNIRQFTFDGFESLDSIQILNAHGIESKRVSTDLSSIPWKTLKDVTNEERCILPSSSLLLEELLSLTRMTNGKIDHVASSSKDMADAVACAVHGAVELGGREDENAERSYYTPAEIVIGPMSGTPYGLANFRGMPAGMDTFYRSGSSDF